MSRYSRLVINSNLEFQDVNIIRNMLYFMGLTFSGFCMKWSFLLVKLSNESVLLSKVVWYVVNFLGNIESKMVVLFQKKKTR